ncbi:hypothetical protein [Kitasatospora sp. NPDC047058]|uniref:hypothetical protein n=1 Tax=Kitasatospora sp. NPDC047058 TaxID=3155620 RepID=UPI0033E2E68E
MSTPAPEVRYELGGIAGRIRRTASPGGIPVVDLIADELEAGGTALAGVDLVRAYPAEVLLPDPPTRQWHGAEGWLSVLRDVLVFAPIGLMWWRLGSALSAYRDSPGGDQFLLAWTKGFPKAGSATATTATLGDAAFQIVLLIAAVVVLTLVVHLLRSRRTGPALDRRRQLLSADLALVTFLLATRLPAPTAPVDARRLHGVAERVAASTTQLESALRRTAEEITAALDSGPASRLQGALDSWNTAAAGLTRAAESLTTPSRTFEAFLALREELARDEVRLRAALENLVAELRRTQEISGDEIHRHDLAVAAVRDLAQTLGEAVQVFTERTEYLIDSTRSIWQLVERIDSRDSPWGGRRADGVPGPGAAPGGLL